MAFCPPSWARRCPAAWPARLSSDPKYIFAPNLWYSSFPALNATTGMPRSAAAFAAGPTCSTWASVTARPSTWLSIAFCTSVACSGAWTPFEYFRSMLCAAAASSAPARIRSQNVSPGCSCVTIAIVYCSPPTVPPVPPPPSPCSCCAPPWLLQPASTAERAATATSARVNFRKLIVEPSFLRMELSTRWWVTGGSDFRCGKSGAVPEVESAQVLDAGPDVGDRALAGRRAGEDGVLLHRVSAPVPVGLEHGDDRDDVDVTGSEGSVHPVPDGVGVGDLTGPDAVGERDRRAGRLAAEAHLEIEPEGRPAQRVE